MRAHSVSLVLVLVLVSVFNAEAKPVDYHDVFGLEYADTPAISPNGERVVYVRHHMDAMADRNLGQLWLIELDSGSQQPLTSGDGSFASPAWSPDGTRIAFTGHDGDGDKQLYVLWLESGRVAKITRGPHPPSNPSWAPDGTRIAFNRFVPTEPPTLVKPLTAPEGANWAPNPTVIDRPVFRVDGQGLLPHG
ncbi:MAG: S9 family peptidase, partial [Gammaproteobacteria bacterium]|nr:S9 family peptidase [Gammaproteobacteria bacterium]